MTQQLINGMYEDLIDFSENFPIVGYIPDPVPGSTAPDPHVSVKILVPDQDILSQLGFDIEAYVGSGLYGDVYKAFVMIK
jgi:hypothetical protein